MPTLQPAGSRVLVTGANGYIALYVIKDLLEEGYTVRGLVRSLDKGRNLKEIFESYSDKLEVAVVEDMMKEGAFDEAVKDVDAIEHMASPVTLTAIEPDDYIQPALRLTLGVLESSIKFGHKVKRIIITSSCAAINRTVSKPTVFDENDWADEAVDFVKEKGRDAPPMFKYRASKTLAERAAWDFYEKHRNEVQWDLVVLNPPFVFGAPLQAVSSPKDLNTSAAIVHNMLTDFKKTDEELKATVNFIDVRDISKAHIEALKAEKAAGERMIIANGASTWQELRNVAHSLRPDLYTSGALPRGNPELDNNIMFVYNPEKGKKVLGFDYTSKEKTISDLLADYEARGWLKGPAQI